jgi:hypothetical protein
MLPAGTDCRARGMHIRNGTGLGQRALLALLTLYALALIVPDLYRIARPLGSFGLAANADGLVYDVRGPFATEAVSPAWQAGVRPGDRLDLAGMRCIPVRTEVCASMLALWGGLNYVMPGRTATLLLVAADDRPARRVTLVAQQRPASRMLNLMLLLDQTAGVLFVRGAAWLVWLRPGGMTWGFFAYAIEFNPGQAFQFYAWLQQWPTAMLALAITSCLTQAGGYTGFLLFALRVPSDATERRWRPVQRALPVLAIGFLALALSSLGGIFGYPTETAMRAALLVGFAVDVAALGILLSRRKDLAPRDYQRVRWVIWGCLIGLPAYLFAELSQVTSLPSSLLGTAAIPEDIFGLIYLVNGVLCLFVVQAVRHPTVVSVAIPLRRATVLGLLLSVPAFFLHQQMDVLDDLVRLPNWAWIAVASGLAFIISRLHELSVRLADGLFDKEFRRAEAQLEQIGQSIQAAASLADIERLLVDAPVRSLRLVSAALFREQDGSFRRQVSIGWSTTDADLLPAGDPLLAARFGATPYQLDEVSAADGRFPAGLARPLLGVPVGNPRRCFAVVLYSGHEIGTDLAGNERNLLAGLARHAVIAYAHVQSEMLHQRIATLEGELSRANAAA